MDAVNLVNNFTRRMADNEDRRRADELLLLREFYVRWRRLHTALNELRDGHELTREDTERVAEMSQRLVDQSNAVKAHQK